MVGSKSNLIGVHIRRENLDIPTDRLCVHGEKIVGRYNVAICKAKGGLRRN